MEQCKDCIDFCEITLTEIARALEKGEPWFEFWCALNAGEVHPDDEACEDFKKEE